MMKIVKKDGSHELFNEEKIIKAVKKSAERVMVQLTENQLALICKNVKDLCTTYRIENETDYVPVSEVHKMVEKSLSKVDQDVAESYRSYRNYKTDFVQMLDGVYKKTRSIMYLGDKENANVDSTLIATKRSLIAGELSKELYQKFFLTQEEVEIVKDGYIYIHDMKDRILGSINCCLFDAKTVLKNGFEMGNIWYNEPKTLDTACDVLGDVILSASAMQYGGFSIPMVDELLGYYAEKSYNKYIKEIYNDLLTYGIDVLDIDESLVKNRAMTKVRREVEQGIQGLEIKLNTIASSRGDFAFVTFSFGLGTSVFEQLVTETLLKVRMKGQGAKGKEIPVLFPKLTMFYDENLHGDGKPLEYLFDLAIKCSSEANYPDYISLSGDDYVSKMYQQYGLAITPMGCRAWLSPFYERGGMSPADEQDKPIFTSRFNLGAISLNLPMIYQKAKVENKDFYDVLDYYLQVIRNLHLRTYDYIGEMTASTNPLGFCHGGLYKGYLKPTDKIAPLLESATASFGVTALNELCQLHYQKSIYDDPTFALEVMEHINKRVAEFKKEDGRLFAIYGTPKSVGGLTVM